MAVSFVSDRRPVTVQVIDRLTSELERSVSKISREDAIRVIRDIFVVKRLKAAALAEDLRMKALQLLMKNIEESPGKLSIPMILMLVKQLSEIGTVDLGIATGNPTTNGGVNLFNVVRNAT